jgi:hypothetical protein
MNMGVVVARGNRETAIFISQAVKNAFVEAGKGSGHFPYQFPVFGDRISVAYPAAEPAQNKSPAFSTMTFTPSCL